MPESIIAPTPKVIIKIRLELSVIHESKALSRIEVSFKILIVPNIFLEGKAQFLCILRFSMPHQSSLYKGCRIVTDTWNAGEQRANPEFDFSKLKIKKERCPSEDPEII